MSEEAKSSEIKFDEQYDRDFKEAAIDYRKLIELMKAGAEPKKNGDVWTVEVYDILGSLGHRELEEKVINQVRAYGVASIERTTTGLALKLKADR